jgi:2-dehydropantoate 2-reductase
MMPIVAIAWTIGKARARIPFRTFRRQVLKICILGAGALGCAIGGVLTEAGNDVWLINRNAAHVEAMNSRGLLLRDSGVDHTVRVQAAARAKDAGLVDLVVVLVKSFDTQQAMDAAKSLVGPDTMVLSLQNGLGHEDILADIVGRERVLAGKTYAGGTQLGLGHVLVGTRGKDTHIGELDGRITERVQRIAAVFNSAGLQTQVSSNIMGTMWDKLLINVATGALTGITRLTYGDLYQQPELEACAAAAVAEAMAVARASGIVLSITEPRDAWLKASAGLPYEFKTSMLQSLEKSSVTEIDFINGAVVRWGAKCGVPTPVNQTLVACIKGIETAMLQKSAHSNLEVA